MSPRIFLVAEKPSIAKAVSTHLSGGAYTVRNTGSKYVKNYDFTFRFPAALGGPGELHATMSSVIGHVMAQDFETQYRKWNSCAPGSLFEARTVEFVDQVCAV